MADRTIRVTVVGDSRSLKSALKDSEASLKSLDASAAKSQASLQKMDSSFAAVGKWTALVAGASAVSAAFLQVVDAAGRMQAATAANERVFGGESTRLKEAAKAAESYGLSQSQYLQTSAKLGAQLQNLGQSQQHAATSAQVLMRTGENLAAVFGTDVPQAVTAISAALRGEFDPLEQYGVKLTAAKVAAEQSAKGISQAQAVMNLVMEQSKFSVGAAASAMDTYAGKQRRFAAAWENAQSAIGEGFLPAASAAVDALSGIVGIVGKLPTGMREFIGTMLVAVAVVKALHVAFGVAAAKTAVWAASLKASETYVANGATSMGRLSGALAKIGNALPIIGAGVLAYAETLSFLDDRIAEGATKMEDFTRSLADTGTLSSQQFESVAGSIARVSEGTSNWATALAIVTGGSSTLVDKWMNADFKSAQLEIDNLNRSLEEMMAVNPAGGAAAVYAARDALVRMGMDSATAAQHLSGSLVMADNITRQYGADAVNAASQTQALVAAFDAASARASAFGHALDALFAGLDVRVAMQGFREQLAGLKAAMAGGLDARELMAFSQAWRTVSDAMMKSGASTDSIIARYDSMRAAMRSALAEVGVTGKEADRILNDVFGKRREFVATVKANADPAIDQATRANKALRSVRQNTPAKIVARWLGGGDTNRADRDIDNVKQNSPARIDADASPAIAAANSATYALQAAERTYTAVLHVALSLGEGVSTWLENLWGGFADRMDFGEETEPWMGAQMRMAGKWDPLAKALGYRGAGSRGYRIDVELRISDDGTVETSIKQLTKLQKLAQQTTKAGKPTALARLAREELENRREQLALLNQFIRRVKVRFNGESVGYTKLKQKLDSLRQSMRQLAQELAEAINGVSIGEAFANMTSKRGDLQSTIDDLKGQLKEFEQQAAESFNPNVVAYYNRRIRETNDEIARLEAQRTGTTLQAELQAQVAQTARFYNQLRRLRKAGLSAEALAELARQGPEAGVQIAQRMLDNPQLRQAYNQAYRDAARFSRSLGTELAQDVYRPQITAVTDAIAKLEEKIRKWLRKHRTVDATINFTNYKLPKAKDLPDWVTNPRRRIIAEQHVNVTVQGMVADPEGTARAIRRLLRDSANRNGSLTWTAA